MTVNYSRCFFFIFYKVIYKFIQVYPLQSSSPRYDALTYSMFPLIVAGSKFFLIMAFRAVVVFSSSSPQHCKIDVFWAHSWDKRIKKNYMEEQSLVNMLCSNTGYFWWGKWNFHWSMHQCVILMQHPRFAFPQIRPDIFPQASKDVSVFFGIYCSILQYIFMINNSILVKENNEHFLCSWFPFANPLHALFWKSMLRRMRWIIRRVVFKPLMVNVDTMFLLFVRKILWHKFGAQLP